MIEELVKCFKEENDTIRELASSAIMKVANVERGREYIVENKIIVDVTKLFEDDIVGIRSNAYHTLINLADFMYGISSIIDYEINVIEILVNRLVLEVEESILILVLKLMNVLLEGGRSQSIILTTLAHPRLNEHLQSKNKLIRELAARNLGSISFNERGKEATIKAESIPLLCKMLHDEVSDCRIAATRALCSLAQLKEGKVQIFDLGEIETIIKLLDDPSDQTRLNVVQLIAALAEYPDAREKSKDCLPTLRNLVDDEKFPLVSRFAATAIDVIVWTP